jgi:CRISPR-associated exonuclease Cas4
MLLILAIGLIVVGLIALGFGRRVQIEAGLPTGRVVYSDTGAWKTVEKPLFSSTYGLAGKPDYLVKQARQTMPVEVKSATAPNDGPRRGHVLQLAAYCLLVEETYQARPASGIVKYANRMFEVDYTPALESNLLDMMDTMRSDLARGAAHRSHHDAGRCLRCGYRHACDERLA